MEAISENSSLKGDAAKRANLEGAEYHRQGKLPEAEACYRHALELNPDFPEALNNLGSISRGKGQFAVAERCLRKALSLKPDYPQALNNLGNLLGELNRLSEAENSYREALRLKPDYVEAYVNLGNLLRQLDKIAEAEQCYLTAINLNPDMLEAHANICNLFEKTNQTEKLRDFLSNITADQYARHPGLTISNANLLRHEKKYQEALALIKKINLASIANTALTIEVLALMGDLADRLGNHEEAFEYFKESKKRAAINYERIGADKSKFLNGAKAIADQLAVRGSTSRETSVSKPVRLAFMVGFPRSGTTLLDSILRGHPEVEVIEEKPMLARTLEEAGRQESANPGFFAQIDDAQIAGLREIYLDEMKKFCGSNNQDKLIIDKLPLNLIYGGFIHRLFPEARFILVLRDPRDCVLSCFMQDFRANDAMANFLTLEDAAGFYDFVMRLWKRDNDLLTLPVVEVRYENLVTELEASVRPLLDFLGLPWNDAVIRFQETALKRNQIKTPSYHQVVQPIYQNAKGRWNNYKNQMERVIPVLAPWIKEFGYEN